MGGPRWPVNQFIVPSQPRICSRTLMWYSRDGSLLPSIFMLTCALLVTSSNSEGHGIPISKCGRYPVRERHAAAARNAVALVELYVPGKRIKRTKPPSGCTFLQSHPKSTWSKMCPYASDYYYIDTAFLKKRKKQNEGGTFPRGSLLKK